MRRYEIVSIAERNIFSPALRKGDIACMAWAVIGGVYYVNEREFLCIGIAD